MWLQDNETFADATLVERKKSNKEQKFRAPNKIFKLFSVHSNRQNDYNQVQYNADRTSKDISEYKYVARIIHSS